jgi:hypothetical protein
MQDYCQCSGALERIEYEVRNMGLAAVHPGLLLIEATYSSCSADKCEKCLSDVELYHPMATKPRGP